ncbi:hypothetical protein [Gordonia rubripertincta]|uniref:hypothetical protein n=1 Tax=Gordonia rubripertincta TaxID=36822 RepID=UPI0015FE259A|nr:hypothetical protein [Gordonia rubripertincta]QMU19687.1 hypothetical protein H3V45_16645 [Gordonia rubripertincta]
MYQLRIVDTIPDFDVWRRAFDRYEPVRVDNGVLAYRVMRSVTDPTEVTIELDFADVAHSRAYVGILEKIWSTSGARNVSDAHSTPTIHEVMVDKTIDPATSEMAGSK